MGEGGAILVSEREIAHYFGHNPWNRIDEWRAGQHSDVVLYQHGERMVIGVRRSDDPSKCDRIQKLLKGVGHWLEFHQDKTEDGFGYLVCKHGGFVNAFERLSDPEVLNLRVRLPESGEKLVVWRCDKRPGHTFSLSCFDPDSQMADAWLKRTTRYYAGGSWRDRDAHSECWCLRIHGEHFQVLAKVERKLLLEEYKLAPLEYKRGECPISWPIFADPIICFVTAKEASLSDRELTRRHGGEEEAALMAALMEKHLQFLRDYAGEVMIIDEPRVGG